MKVRQFPKPPSPKPDPPAFDARLDRRVPAATVAVFEKRTSVVCLRIPDDLSDELQKLSSVCYMTKSSYCLRVLYEHVYLQRLPRNRCLQKTA